MMRTRSSPRCSMNDILSSTRAMSRLPALDEVAQRTHAATRLEPAADRGGDVRLCLANRVGQLAPEGQARGDRGRERAPGAVRGRRLDARAGESREARAVPQDVGRTVLQVTAL